MNANDYIYDIEVYPNVFTLTLISARTLRVKVFEISNRKNDLGGILNFVERAVASRARMVGYNNLGYDYPVVHYLLTEARQAISAEQICLKLYQKSCQIIATPFSNRFANVISTYKEIIPQIDLLKIHHFDNTAKATSLKILEFNMEMENIEDLPFPPGTVLSDDEISTLVTYNIHDVRATHLFYLKTLKQIEFREGLSVKYNRNFLNHNDTKIGKDYFVMCLERELGKLACFYKEGGKRKIRQTIRDEIALRDVIFDYVKFETAPFQAVKNWLDMQVISETKGVFTELPLEEMVPFLPHSSLMTKRPKVKDWFDDVTDDPIFGDERGEAPRVPQKMRRLSVDLDGVEFVFGTGGIHASIHNTRVDSDEDNVIIDLDVTSYYPSLAIANKVYPEHLSDEFCRIYADMKAQRVTFPKGTPENAMLKLALNGVYGDSNNKYSPFYDPQYTMTITVNGQLLLCMFYEMLRHIENLELIQVNTDGLTVKVPRESEHLVMEARTKWEKLTKLDLEVAKYKYMFIRDVNSYVAQYEDFKKGEKFKKYDDVKRKGAYEFDLEWHKNHSHIVTKKAAVAYISDGTDIREFIENHDKEHDFMLRTKVPKTSRLVEDHGYMEYQIQNVSRYYISKTGPELVKVMPPLPKNPDKERRIGINIGCSVREANHFTGIDRKLIDYDWYVEQAEKLVNFDFEHKGEIQ